MQVTTTSSLTSSEPGLTQADPGRRDPDGSLYGIILGRQNLPRTIAGIDPHGFARLVNSCVLRIGYASEPEYRPILDGSLIFGYAESALVFKSKSFVIIS